MLKNVSMRPHIFSSLQIQDQRELPDPPDSTKLKKARYKLLNQNFQNRYGKALQLY